MTMNTVRTHAVRSLFAACWSTAAPCPRLSPPRRSSPAAPTDDPDLTTGGNRWTITAYNDASPVHDQWATQGICFRFIGTVGTHNRYEWWSDTFPDWNGIATQEGDEIFMHGDYANDVGHDGIRVEHRDLVDPEHRRRSLVRVARGRQASAARSASPTRCCTRVGRCVITLDEAKLLPLPIDIAPAGRWSRPSETCTSTVPKQ